MFGNFLYFIVVLLIYSTYQPTEKTNFTAFETLLLFIGLTVAFAGVTRALFSRLEKRLSRESISRIDPVFNATVTRQSILAIMLFAIDIYGLNLSSFLSTIRMFKLIPTIEAVFFLGLFVCYLAIVWFFAHRSYRIIHQTDLTRRAYVLSNISFSLPVLLPWLLLSGIADIIRVLPFELPKRFLSTTEGEIIYFLIFLFGVAIIGPAMIQKFWRCTPLESGYTRSRIEALCKRAKLEYANILFWPIFGGKMITAGVMGLIKHFRYILVTDALIRYLNPDEIDAVIAHEIGHIKRKHLLFYLFFFVGYLLLSYASFDLIIFSILYAKPVYRFIEITGLDQATVISALFSTVIIALFLVYFRYIFGYFMRNFERQADIFVYELFDSARPLISTFGKIVATSGQSPDRPNWHHYSIRERITYLKKCEADRKWITTHHRKIRKSIAVYVVGMIAVGMIGYHLNFGETGRNISTHFFEQIILRAIEKDPDNSDLYGMLGDLFFGKNQFEEAIVAYETGIRLEPNDARILNNLAWLYATCENKSLRDPKKALALAQRAAEQEPAPHILDTLAESFYVNGRFEEAIVAERQALGLARGDRTHYKDQLKKFMEAAGEAGPKTDF